MSDYEDEEMDREHIYRQIDEEIISGKRIVDDPIGFYEGYKLRRDK